LSLCTPGVQRARGTWPENRGLSPIIFPIIYSVLAHSPIIRWGFV